MVTYVQLRKSLNNGGDDERGVKPLVHRLYVTSAIMKSRSGLDACAGLIVRERK